jgi:hypothetical protein
MVEEFDPLEEDQGAAGRRAGGEGSLLDLPLGGDEDLAPPAAVEAPPQVWEPRHRRRSRPRQVRPWLLILLLLVVAAAAWWFWPRGAPAQIETSVAVLEFGERRIGVPGEPVELSLTNRGERQLKVRRFEIVGEAAELYQVVTEACTERRVAAGDSCRLAVDYLPRESGDHQAVLRVVARAANSPVELALSGAGVAPRLALDPERFGFEPLPVGGRSAGRALRLESVGDAVVTVGELVIEGPAAADFQIERDRCSSRALASGDDCSLRVAFAPLAEGERQAALRVVSDAVTGTATIALSGDGLTAPEVSLSPSRVQFGEQLVGDRSDPATLTFSNRGSGGLELGRASVQGDAGGYLISEDDCSRSQLGVDAECTLQVVFAPTAEGSLARRLELPQAGDTGLSWGADLAGTAVAPRVEWSAGKLDWGDSKVGVSGPARDLQLRNAGSGTLRVSGLRLSGADADAFGLSADGCTGRSLDPGSGCELTVTFRAARLGSHRARLAVEGRGTRGARAAELAGSGVAGRIEPSAERLEFGSVRVSEAGSRELTLANTGNAEVTLSGFSAAGRAPDDYRVSGDCRVGAALAPGDTCRMVIRFSPQREGGRLATLEIAHDGVESPARVPLSGAALAPPPGELRIEPARMDFGEVQVGGRSGILPLTLSNTGRGRLRLREIRVGGRQPGEFQIVPGTCEGIPFLAPGGRCGIGLRFRPSAGGARSATLTVRHDAPGGELRVSLGGLGLATGAP